MSGNFNTRSPVENRLSDSDGGKLKHVFHYGFYGMGTRFELVLPGVDSVDGQSLAESVESRVLALEAKLSRFDPDSIISNINRRAFHEAVPLNEELWEVFNLCDEYHKKTGGAFDIAILPIIQLWKNAFQDENYPEPPAEKITSVLQGCGMRHLELDSAGRTLRFHHPSVEVDLGGFGKGFAVWKTLRYLQYEGIEKAFISFGESSVCVIGSHPSGKPWPVCIEHLFDRGRSVHTFDLIDASLSTSGNALVSRNINYFVFN